jgi:hypothetical protein
VNQYLIKSIDGRNIGGILTGTPAKPIVVLVRHWFGAGALPDLRGKKIVYGDGSEAIVLHVADVSYGVIVVTPSRAPTPVPLGSFGGGTAIASYNDGETAQVPVTRSAWAYDVNTDMRGGLSGSPLLANGKVIGLADTTRKFIRLDVIPALLAYVTPTAPAATPTPAAPQLTAETIAILQVRLANRSAMLGDGRTVPYKVILDAALKGITQL